MRIDILTLFPEFFDSPLDSSILRRAAQSGQVAFHRHDLRDFAEYRRKADDRPYGGGSGMLIKPDLIFRAVESLPVTEGRRVIYTSPQGKVFNQAIARQLATESHLVILCGHYEGVDERVCDHLVTDEISIGDYVLTGGEIAALTIADAVVRLLPGVIGKAESHEKDSFSEGLLDYPHYTRPPVFRGWEVPPVLQSGNHIEIEKWRREQMLLRTWLRRPDLLEDAPLSKNDRLFLKKLAEKNEL